MRKNAVLAGIVAAIACLTNLYAADRGTPDEAKAMWLRSIGWLEVILRRAISIARPGSFDYRCRDRYEESNQDGTTMSAFSEDRKGMG
jgi:uncharacterized membrane protein